MSQEGCFGEQIMAPRSIIACAKSPGRSTGTMAAALALISDFPADSGVEIE